MAEVVIPPGYGLMQLFMTHATIAHTAVTTLGFEVASDPWTQSDSDSALAAWATSLQPLHDNEVTYGKLVTLVGNDGPALRFESAGATQGSRAAVTITSPQVSYLIKKSSAFAGRRFRGRMYIPFVNSLGFTQTGSLTAGELTILTARAAALASSLSGAGPNIASLRLLHAESPLSSLPDPTTITALAAEGVVATQRRRLRRS